jgi:hypothetical protein
VEVETVIMVVETLDSRLVVLVTVYGMVVVMDEVAVVTEIAEVVDMQSIA